MTELSPAVKVGSLRKKWDKRFFVLRGDVLRCYPEEVRRPNPQHPPVIPHRPAESRVLLRAIAGRSFPYGILSGVEGRVWRGICKRAG